jgi:octopine/nopaline transport system permease protein
LDLTLLGWGDLGWGDEMIYGALMTLAVAACSYGLGIVFGSIAAAMKLSNWIAARLLADGYTTIIRGLPELLIIIDLPIFVTGMICIGLSAGAYSTEVIRGAVLAVAPGQIEAARAVGMSRPLRFRRVLLPQVARYALPGLGNVWQLTLKETSLISVIGLVEIMRQAAVGAGSTKEPFTFYITAFVLYLGLASISNRGFLRAEVWANRGVRTT